MDKNRLNEIVSKISGYDEYFPIVAFLEQLQEEDKAKFIEFVKASGYWKENDLIGSIINFVKGYVKANKIDTEKTKDGEFSLGKIYSNFSSSNNYTNMSMWDIAMYYAKQRDNSDTKKR